MEVPWQLIEKQPELSGRQAPVKVDVCVCTYRRPEGLDRLLTSLGNIDLRTPSAIDMVVVVIDNDPNGPFAISSAGWPAHRVVHQPIRGIPFARNAGLGAVRDDAEFIAFVDDDEVVSPQWLQSHLATIENFHLDVSAGPVRPLFEGDPPSWVIEEPKYYREEHPEGARLFWGARTGNALVRASWVAPPISLRFDESIGLGGGSDRDFFTTLISAGGAIGWSANAIVWEHVPESRQSLRWVFRRYERLGYEAARRTLKSDSRPQARLELVGQAGKTLAVCTRRAIGQAIQRKQWRNSMLRSGRALGIIRASAGGKNPYYE